MFGGDQPLLGSAAELYRVQVFTDKRCIKLENGQERCKVAIQTNNVEADERGLVYLADRAGTGLHIVRLTGEAARIVGGN